MISGVRASSIRIESTSSTIAYQWPRCTVCSSVDRHVVAQVVEAELRVGAVGDVAAVGGAALVVGHHVLDHADRDAQRLVDRPHPAGVAAGQVVVDRHQVDVDAGQGVQVERQRWPPGSCPRPSSSRRSGPRGAPCRRPSGRRSGACRASAWQPRGRRRTPRAAARRGRFPASNRSRNSIVLAASSSSDSASISGSSALISSTRWFIRFSVRPSPARSTFWNRLMPWIVPVSPLRSRRRNPRSSSRRGSARSARSFRPAACR